MWILLLVFYRSKVSNLVLQLVEWCRLPLILTKTSDFIHLLAKINKAPTSRTSMFRRPLAINSLLSPRAGVLFLNKTHRVSEAEEVKIVMISALICATLQSFPALTTTMYTWIRIFPSQTTLIWVLFLPRHIPFIMCSIKIKIELPRVSHRFNC